MANSLFVLVTGATGKQGGALARMLLKRDHRVRAFTRSPDSPAAVELKRMGAEIYEGSFDDRSSIERAMQGVDAVFAMGTPAEAGIDVEIRQGKNIADVAKTVGVKHYVYSSVASANRGTGIPHFDSKEKVEQHVRTIGLPFTIVGPVYFMENIFSPWVLPDLQKKGRLAIPLPGACTIQQICLDDIASFVTLVVENRDQFLNRRFDIAGDELTGFRATDILSRISGRTISYHEVPLHEVALLSQDMATMFDWFNHVGTEANVELLRRQFPEVGWHTLEQWAAKQDWSVLEVRKAA